jgi:hypothetical protein
MSVSLAGDGNSAFLVYGSSGGAVVALEAAARGLPITKLGLWEPPFYVDDEPVRRPPTTKRDCRLPRRRPTR